MKGLENLNSVNFSDFATKIGKNKTNFKRTIIQNLTKIDKWLNAIGLEINIKQKTD